MKRFVVDLRVSRPTGPRILVSYMAIGATTAEAIIAARNAATKAFQRVDGIASVYPSSCYRRKVHAGDARQL
jgi:hypothetical protein